jgi:undecaprenyl-diphosphatase
VKRSTVFYWLVGIVIAAMAVAAAFYFDGVVGDFMAQHQSRAVREFMRNVSLFGDWPSHVVLGLLLFGIAWLRSSKKWMRIFLSMLFALSLAGVIGYGIKVATARARPSVKIEQALHLSRLSSKYHAFPSGHVGASTAFFGVLFFVRRRIGLPCVLIPIVIGFSRMYIGAHYLSDVVCAAVLGILCAFLVAYFFLQKARDQQSSKSRITSTSGN